MKISLTFIAFIFFLTGCASLGSSPTPPIDTKPHFRGFDIEVFIDGNRTTPLAEPLPFKDIEGVAFHTADWQAEKSSKDGRPCFKFNITNPSYLGKLRDVSLNITEINFEREGDRWRKFKALPNPGLLPPYTGIHFKEGEVYCPKEFILTERLRHKRLPAGTYHISMGIYGVESWDRQGVLLIVE
jgi:hypothetical protein